MYVSSDYGKTFVMARLPALRWYEVSVCILIGHTRMCMHTHTHAHTRTHTQTRVCTHTHTNAHTDKHTHNQQYVIYNNYGILFA